VNKDTRIDDNATERRVDPFPPGTPQELGFDPERLNGAMEVVAQGWKEGAYPGAVALVARRGKIAATRAIGHAQVVPEARAMTTDTIFDLASVTKVVAGVTAALLLVDAGAWSLDDPVVRFLPAFATAGKGPITLRQLLTHTSGLPPWRPCYTAARTVAETFAYIRDAELECAPGMQVQYSDLGMAVIRQLAETVSGIELEPLLQHHIFEPLGLRDTGYLPSYETRERIAATERGNRYEQDMVARAGLHFDGWRDHVLVGEVDDGNTHYALGGVSSHAGLFATAADLARFGQMYLQGGAWQGRRIISAATIREATRPQTVGLNDSYGLGWRLLRTGWPSVAPPYRSALTRAIFPTTVDTPPPRPPAGGGLSVQTYGHTGFTGTSLVLDPVNDLVLILLTNRIHPDATRTGLDHLRARWHDAVAAALVPSRHVVSRNRA